MGVEGLTLDFFGTLVGGGGRALMTVCSAVVDDHALPSTPEGFLEAWSRRYFALNEGPFLTIRQANALSLRETLAAFGAPSETAAYVDLLEREYRSIRPYPEVPEFLDRVKDYAVCVLSNVDTEFMEETARRCGLRFDLVVTSEGVRAYKPDPRVFQSALGLLGLRPEQVLHAGDSPEMDVLGARNARMWSAWVNRSGTVLDDHLPAPDVEVPDLLALADHLEGLHG